ncbi:MAG: hypothetical protein ABW215_01810 [Kibdelosporangium sp.]
MGQFGELFGAAKLRKESQDDDGTGERFDPGPLDLTSGVIPVRPRPKQPAQPEQTAPEDDS